MPRVPAESRAATAGKWLLALVIPGSALAIGSLPPEVLVVMSVLAAAACGLLWSDRAARISRPSHWVLIALAVLLGMTILQALPLPATVCRAVAPASADIWARSLTPLREAGPNWHPLSVAPPATRLQVLRGFFYGCIFLAALRVTALERGERFLGRVVIGSTALMAFVSLAHTAVSAESVFGIYHPHEIWAYAPGRLSPLLNTNHLAAYLGLGACVSVGALLSGRTMPRALSGSLALVLVATTLWQGSRGATGALVFSLALAVALAFYTRRRVDGARVQGLILAACVVAATVTVTIAVNQSSEHLLSRDFSKVDVAARSLELVRASPWLGFGRGGFETVFSSVRQSTSYVTWTNPEDMFIQWLVEWGVPVTVAGFGLLAFALRPQVLLRSRRPAIGAWVALVGTFIHELADYHLEVPGIVAVVAVCAAIVVGSPATSSGSDLRRTSPFVRAAVPAVAIGTLAAVAAVWPDMGHTLAKDRRFLSAEAIDRNVPGDQFRDDIRAAMLRYPAEPFLPLMGAVRAAVTEEGSVLPWTARALERNPRFGRAHFVLARSLATGHPAQARLEYRLAYGYDDALREAIAKEAIHIVNDSTSALELVTDGVDGVDLLDALVKALGARLPSTAVILDEEIERRVPGSVAPLRRRAEAAAKDASEGAPWCPDGKACMADALAVADRLVRVEPDKCGPRVLIARLRVKEGNVQKALDDLERASDGVSDRAECRRQLISLALANGERRRGEAALEQLVKSGCGAAPECLDLYGWAADVEERSGHYVRAVRLYRKILELTPERDDLLEHIGELGERDGLLSEGLDAYATLASRHPSDGRYPARMAELRAHVLRRPTAP